MFQIVIVLLAVPCALGATVPEGIDGRIVGGSLTQIENIPYQVVVFANQVLCGGSIIDKNIILTTAHCVQGVPTAQISIRAGSSEWGTGGVTLRVVDSIIHEDYAKRPYDNDIAVLKLEYPLVFGAKIGPIGLASSPAISGKPAVVSGWGRTSNGGVISTVLRYADVNVITKDDCTTPNYSYEVGQITDRMLCAAAAGKDSCQGDSGGPLVYNNELVGIVSWGMNCADPNFPGVYVDVYALHDWVNSTVENL